MNIEMNSCMVYLVKNEWIYDFLMKLSSLRRLLFQDFPWNCCCDFCKKNRLHTNYKPETDIELDWQFFREFTTVTFSNKTLFTTPTSPPGYSVKLLRFLQTGNGYWFRLAIFREFTTVNFFKWNSLHYVDFSSRIGVHRCILHVQESLILHY